MANSKSAKKRVFQNEKRRVINLTRNSAIKTAVKKVVIALDNNDIDQARTLFKDAESKIFRAVGKGLLHKNAASRKISRLAKRLIQVAS
jgi:small subunit ribosomal protein S20